MHMREQVDNRAVTYTRGILQHFGLQIWIIDMNMSIIGQIMGPIF